MKTKKTDSISDQLRRIMAESALSRYEVARQSGVDQGALSRFANGQRGLTTESLDRLAPVLGLELRRVRKPRAKKGG
jgi:transcriptional regulator with XRE-family HTH domain